MKKIIRKVTYIGLVSSGLFLASCNDAIDITQPGEASEEVMYQTVDDLQKGLNGVYIQYNPGANSNGNGDAILFNDLFTDNLRTGSSYGGHGIQTYNHNLQASSYTPESIWINRLATINYANRVLVALERVSQTVTSSADIAAVGNIKAQLLAIRAIAHYDMFMYFTTDYTNPTAASTVIMDYVPALMDRPTRSTVAEVVEFIKGDLAEASQLITNATTTPFYINADVIKAFQAKLALATADYATAGSLAQELLTKYPLSNKEAYKDMFKDLGNGDAIFTLMRVRGNSSVAGSWYSNETNATGSPLFNMSRQLYDLYNSQDVRIELGAILDETSDPSNNLLLINKYPGSETPLLNHIKLVRGAEMALIVAETKARQGDLAGAAAQIKAINDIRVGIPTATITYNSLNEALVGVLNERRKELAFEGHRYLDIKRLGKEVGVGISRLASDANSFSDGAPTTLPATDYRFTLPIPRIELDANPTIGQNPNY